MTPNKNVTSSTIISSLPCTLEKIIVNSHTSGTFKLFNGTNYSATAVGGTFSCATGSGVLDLEPLGFNTALYMAVGGTADYTVLYNGTQLR